MDTKISERKNIIVSLKSNYGEPKKGIEKRIQFLKRITILYLIMALFSGGILFLSIVFEVFDSEIFKWEKTGLLAILSLSIVLNLPKQCYELKLLKHIKKIDSKPDFIGIDKLNRELKNTIDKLNDRFRIDWILIVLAILIVIMGIWQMGFEDNNPYWNYMKLPIIVFYGIILFRFIITNKKLTKNINETEK